MEKRLTTGNVFHNILVFSLPYLFSYLLQTLYGMADLYIIGQFGAVFDTTAVSIGSQVMHMLTVMIVGLATASGSVISAIICVTVFAVMAKKNKKNANGIFLVLDGDDRFEGETTKLDESLCVTVRFHGTHAHAKKQYERLTEYIKEHELKITGFSREITMIDYAITDESDRFVTEIAVPVSKKANCRKIVRFFT